MHPFQPDAHLFVARSRSAELRREAAAWRLARAAGPRTAHGPRARPRRSAVRRRVGWALVETGLRLVHSGRSATAP
ncbi:hypothetical protein V1L54_16925 [Streptomyces sp. TRM 70361]|uniref:hypothetical protein n=1 Tax=Streptomyces sp. TRM 70361 TaxID=3116553 RepID=UPI002E7AC8C3|nr:hypothetical protein [Streptomyces sp. TRM 70361]MEE1941067.1 hypothetical protein [Streptomyces sp. TRM 70361]